MDNDNHNNKFHRGLGPNRLEAFSDGVLAIIITITVLEFKIPHGHELHDLVELIPLFIAYLISFQTIGTYWNNHHHLLLIVKRVTAPLMWANLLLLFCLSFIPFATSWLGENHGGKGPTFLYSTILLASALAYQALQLTVLSQHKNDKALRDNFKTKPKGIISLILYILAIIFSVKAPWVSDVLIIIVSLAWFIPDRRITKHIS